MTTENWLTVVSIVVALIVPLIKAILDYKLKNKKRTSTSGTAVAVGRKQTVKHLFLLNFIFFSILAANLFFQIFSAEPITRLSVFAISLSVASILFMLITVYTFDMIGRIIGTLEMIVSSHMVHDDAIRGCLSVLGKINTKKRRQTSPSIGRAKKVRR